jgi:hypothetical protein
MLAIPEGERGEWRIAHREITEQDADRINWIAYQKDRLDEDMGMMRFISDGVFTSLYCGEAPFMSDHSFEVCDSARFAKIAHGDVLISGLGLGVVIGQLERNRRVRSITVLEKSSEVIELVAPHVGGCIIEADSFLWKPPAGTRFDWAWHDIWPSISPKNAVDMVTLYGHHRRWVEKQMFWSWPQIIAHMHLEIVRATQGRKWDQRALLIELLNAMEGWTTRLWPDGSDHLEFPP